MNETHTPEEARAGRIVTVGIRPHCCQPPDIFTWDLDSPRDMGGPPPLTKVLYAGTVWVCACGLGQVVWDKPSSPGMVNGLTWRPETRRERRKRLRIERRTRDGEPS